MYFFGLQDIACEHGFRIKSLNGASLLLYNSPSLFYPSPLWRPQTFHDENYPCQRRVIGERSLMTMAMRFKELKMNAYAHFSCEKARHIQVAPANREVRLKPAD